VCIRYRGKVSTEPFPSNNRGIFTEPSRYLATIVGYFLKIRKVGYKGKLGNDDTLGSWGNLGNWQ
jgi:hypothetical protein